MLLNNFITSLYPNLVGTLTTGNLSGNINYYSSVLQSLSPSYYSETGSGVYYNLFGRGIVFGSGTTPPQKTDYKLNNHITTGLTYNNNSTSTNNNVVSWVQTVQNTSTEQITITEVGLFSAYSDSQPTLLLTRTVLDNPVILQPNEVKTFTITIDYNKFVDGTIIQNA